MSEHQKETFDASTLLELTAKIVSAYAGNATISPAELTDVIASVSNALGNLRGGADLPEQTVLTPAVPVKKSVTPDFIICLEDGKKLKMLKRHLMNAYRMTPQSYREKWSLPHDYPMVAPNYAATRSQLAKKFGLGTAPAKIPEASNDVAAANAAAPAPRRGRPKKLAA